MWQFEQTADLLQFLKDSNPQVIDMLNRDRGLLQNGFLQALKQVPKSEWQVEVLVKLRNVLGDGLFESSYMLKEIFLTEQPLLSVSTPALTEMVRQVVQRTEHAKNNFEHLEYSRSGVVSSKELYDLRVLQFSNKLLTEVAEHERVDATYQDKKGFEELSTLNDLAASILSCRILARSSGLDNYKAYTTIIGRIYDKAINKKKQEIKQIES